MTTFVGGAPGPHVMVNALAHGNEICGAHALAFLLERQVHPRRGRLTLSFANVAAYLSFDWNDACASRLLDEDFNRLWGGAELNGPRQSRELLRARALKPVIDEVDYLLDLHSMSLPGPPLVLCGMTEKGARLARALGYPAYVVADAGHAKGVRLRDYGPFAARRSPKTALLVECGQHFELDSARVAVEVTLRFLDHFGLIDSDFAASYLPRERPVRQRFVRVSEAVTIESDRFTFARDFRSFEVISGVGTPIADDGGRLVRTPYDDSVLVMPSQDLRRGQTAVRFGRFAAEF